MNPIYDLLTNQNATVNKTYTMLGVTKVLQNPREIENGILTEDVIAAILGKIDVSKGRPCIFIRFDGNAQD